MKRLQGRLRSLVAADMVVIQLRRIVLGLNFLPIYAFCSPFSTFGMVILKQFLALPQKPLANRKYFCLLNPAINNIQIQMDNQNHEEQQPQPYEINTDTIKRQINKFDWSDIEQSQLGDSPHNDYFEMVAPKQYQLYYRYFRGLLNSEQISERSYFLTTLILKLRSSNYYALRLRSRYFLSTVYDKNMLQTQIFFTNCLLNSNSKEYQLWTYKKQLFQKYYPSINNPKQFYFQESQFMDYLLDVDNKNYHVWDYKLWLTIQFHKENQEIKRTELQLFGDKTAAKELIQQLNMQNCQARSIQSCYSLWSYRHHLLELYKNKLQSKTKQDLQKQQLTRVRLWMANSDNLINENGWNYLTGIALDYSISNKEIIRDLLSWTMQIYKANTSNRFAGGACLLLGDQLINKYKQQCIERKMVLLQLLETDKVREAYYKYLLKCQ